VLEFSLFGNLDSDAQCRVDLLYIWRARIYTINAP
jgi:hypothetical protein